MNDATDDGMEFKDKEADVDEVDGKSDDTVYQWGKKINTDLHRWIEIKRCRHDIVDEHFCNPPNHKGDVFF